MDELRKLQLKSLVAKLGLEVYAYVQDGKKESKKPVVFMKDVRYFMSVFATEAGDVSNLDVAGSWTMFNGWEDLERKLFGKIRHFLLYAGKGKCEHAIRNPYFGCTTMEEALIRRDLA